MFDLAGKEISLVGRPANRRETLLTKSGEKPMDELVEIISETEATNEGELVSKLEDAGVSEEGIEAAKAVARVLDGFGEEVEKSQIAKALDLVIEKEDDEPVNEDGTVTKSDLQGLEEQTQERILKAFDEIETLKSTLAERERQRRYDHWLNKAEELDAISVDAEEEAERLTKIEESLGREDADDYFSTLSGANEVAKEGDLFEEQGRSGSGSNSDAYDKVVSKAEEYMEKNDVSRAAAIDHVMQTDKDLATEYLSER